MTGRIGDVAADLARHQFAQVGAAPVGGGHQILRGGQRLQAAAEARQETVDRIRIAAGLGGDALDDGQQVLRAMADLAQQSAQRLLAALAVGHVDRRGDQALQLAVGRLVRVDRYFIPIDRVAVGDPDLQVLRLGGLQDGLLGEDNSFGFRCRQKVEVRQAGHIAVAPRVRNVLRPHHAQRPILIDQGDAGMAQRAHQAAAQFDIAVRKMHVHRVRRLRSAFLPSIRADTLTSQSDLTWS